LEKKKGSAAFSQLMLLDMHLKTKAVSNAQFNFEPGIGEESSEPQMQES
jgi:hypothetical protein